MLFEKVQFENASGERLSARLDLPADAKPKALALFAHCFTCSKNLKAVGNVSRALTDAGFGVLRFDFTGLGESEGDFANTNFSSNVDDLVVAAEWLEAHYEAPRILIGHSLGGAAVLQAAERIEASQAVATIGAPYDPEHVTHLLDDAIEEIESTGQARVTLAGRQFTIKKQFLDDLSAQNMEAVIGRLGRALMVFHSPLDKTVGVDNAAKIFTAAKHPKSFVSLDTADHLLTAREDSLYVGDVIATWAKKYVDTSVPETDAEVERGTVVTRTASGFRTDVKAGKHAFVADEPASVGGSDVGPTPYDLLLAALGTCTGMTLRMYADRKEWPLKEAVVRLSHEKIHAEDCQNCESTEGKVDRIERTLEIVGDDLTDAQRERLLEIANKCPVHRTLHNEIVVETEVVGDG